MKGRAEWVQGYGEAFADHYADVSNAQEREEFAKRCLLLYEVALTQSPNNYYFHFSREYLQTNFVSAQDAEQIRVRAAAISATLSGGISRGAARQAGRTPLRMNSENRRSQ